MSQQRSEVLDYSDPVKFWEHKYNIDDIYWYKDKPHFQLVKHYEKLNPGNKARNILLPMCGKSLDLEWLSGQGIPLVVGVDGVPGVLQTVMDKSGHKWTESPKPELGSEAKLFTRQDAKMKLYNGDMMKFSLQEEGQFDAIWERGGLIIVPRENVDSYVKIVKSLLRPGGRMLLETIEFDITTVDPEKDLAVPPPFSVMPEDVKSLFEPECSVEHIDRTVAPYTYGAFTNYSIHLIIKR